MDFFNGFEFRGSRLLTGPASLDMDHASDLDVELLSLSLPAKFHLCLPCLSPLVSSFLHVMLLASAVLLSMFWMKNGFKDLVSS